MMRRDLKSIRRSPGYRANPNRIVPFRELGGHWIRVVRWTAPDGARYALGYGHHPRLFGWRQRSTRAAALQSMAWTMGSRSS